MEIKENNKVTRHFGLTNLALGNKMSVFLLLIIVTFLGMYSYVRMPKEAFPEIVIPTIFVGVPYAGNSPIDIENLVTRHIENEINTISNIKDLTSISSQDFATIIVEFNPDVDIPRALQDVKDAVDRARSELPTDLDKEPDVFEINFSEFPIMSINVSGNYDLITLKGYGEYLEDRIERLPEISSVDIRGAPIREIAIEVDVFKMNALEITFQDIENAVSGENFSLSAGDLLISKQRRSVRILGEFTSVEEINQIIVKQEDNEIVYLEDIAIIADGFEYPKSISRSNRMPVITLEVVKRSGENLLIAADQINEIIDDAKLNYLPADIEINIFNDLSKNTRDQVSNLENSIISGVILVILVILFFMGIRNALLVGIAIPLSMFTAFMLLSFFGVTLNIIVLFSLILALGLLVDNGIVVVENIYRLREQGMPPMQAAREGAGEVAMAIISSTATTLSAFVPLLFWEDIIGEFMKYLPLTLIIVLASSLFVALVINPVLTVAYMRTEKPGEKPSIKKAYLYAGIFLFISLIGYISGSSLMGGVFLIFAVLRVLSAYVLTPGSHKFQLNILPKIERFYERSLRYLLNGLKPYLIFAATVLLLICSLILFGIKTPNVTVFPDNEPAYINIFAEFPPGTDIHYTDSVTQYIESETFRVIEPYEHIVEAVITNIGEGSSDPADGFDQTESPNKSRVTISFFEYEHREGISTSMIMAELRREIRNIPGAVITIDKNRAGPPVGRPINIEISGEELEKLSSISRDIINKINASGIEGIEELKSDLETQNPQLIVHVNRDNARRFGLSTQSIAWEMRTALFGREVSKFKEGEDEHPIVVRLADEYRYDIPTLINQRMTFRDQASGKIQQVPISSVADLEYSSTYGAINRRNLDRVVTVYSNVDVGYNANQIVNQLKLMLEHYELPAGYEIRFTGEQEDQEASTDFLSMALMISVFLIFLILVSQFNSFIKPFIIIGSVLFSTIGVFLGLVIFQMDFVVVLTGIGIISLAGIVVNNAIVLIDFIELIRKRRKLEMGLTEDDELPYEEVFNCVVEAGKIRLRPVILTAVTTILGLLPLASGMNINFETLISSLDPQIYFGGDNAIFWSPMAWTVINGLVFATFLTLIGVPAMYLISNRIGNYIRRKL